MSSLLVTGGTGSFGQAFIRRSLSAGDYERIVVYSRDELKQSQMRQQGLDDERLRYFIGDVRDRDRLRRAMHHVDTVVHAAALKQVPTCEYNPSEAIRTNIDGTDNVIHAALDANVRRVLMLSSDKAVDPCNLYGKTKAAAESLIVDANAYAGGRGTIFAATRYGNVISSRGSVLPLFQAQHAAGKPLTITDPEMTRFVLTLAQGVEFVRDSLEVMLGGEVFVPKLPAVTLETIADAVASAIWHDREVVGLRPGEKMHELLVSVNEAGRTVDERWHYLVKPLQDFGHRWGGTPVPAGFYYGSDTAERLDVHEFRALAGLDTTTLKGAA